MLSRTVAFMMNAACGTYATEPRTATRAPSDAGRISPSAADASDVLPAPTRPHTSTSCPSPADTSMERRHGPAAAAGAGAGADTGVAALLPVVEVEAVVLVLGSFVSMPPPSVSRSVERRWSGRDACAAPSAAVVFTFFLPFVFPLAFEVAPSPSLAASLAPHAKSPVTRSSPYAPSRGCCWLWCDDGTARKTPSRRTDTSSR